MALNTELRSDDSERRNWEAMMTLNAETENAMRMALNADTEKWWLWLPKLRSDDDDSEPQNWKMQLWTSNWKLMMALNVETENMTLNFKLRSDGSESRNWEAMMMTLNPETEKCDSKRQTEKLMMALNVKTENVTLNVKLRSDGSECQNWEAVMALNAEIEKRWWWLWTPKLKNVTLNVKLKIDDGSKRRNWECDSERRN